MPRDNTSFKITAGLLGLCLFASTASAQTYEGTPQNVVAMNTMECVTYYTAASKLVTDHEYKKRDLFEARAAEIITQNTPEGDRAAHLEKADEARMAADHLVNRVRSGIVSQDDMAGLIASCDASFGYDTLDNMHDQDEAATTPTADVAIVGQ